MRWRTRFFVVGVLFTIGCTPALLSQTSQAEQTWTRVTNKTPFQYPLLGKPAPLFDGTDIDGNRVDLSQLRGKVVVLKFWSPNCSACTDEFPALNTIVKNYASGSVVFLAPTKEDSTETRSFLARNKVAYAVVPDQSELFARYMVADYPTHIVIDPTGKIVWAYIGSTDGVAQLLASEIAKALSTAH